MKLEILEADEWPGNVLALINALEKAILLPILYPMFLPGAIRINCIFKQTEGDIGKAITTSGLIKSPMYPLIKNGTWQSTLVNHKIAICAWKINYIADTIELT